MVEQLHSEMLDNVECYLVPDWVINLNISEVLTPYVLVPIDIRKPILSRIEYKVTHDCNLNCKGCNSLCGLREKEYADIEEFKSSLKRLKDIFSNITVIKLLGGEPLLHSELYKFIEVIRMIFPAADIEILTNGLLVPSLSEIVCEYCRKYKVRFEISQYPTTMVINNKIIAKLEREDIPYTMRGDTLVFKKRINPFGTCDKGDAKENCPQWYALYEGKLSRCFLWDSLQYLMNRFPEFRVDEQKTNDYVDLYNTRLSGREIIEKLKEPVAHCVYCGMTDRKPELYEWRRASEKDLSTIDSWIMLKNKTE